MEMQSYRLTGLFVFLAASMPVSSFAETRDLLMKEGDDWKIMMEYQKEVLTRAEWDTLKP